MDAVLAMVPAALLEQRRRKGHDIFDEMWEGVLHMVPQPSSAHQRMEFDLAVVPPVDGPALSITWDGGSVRM